MRAKPVRDIEGSNPSTTHRLMSGLGFGINKDGGTLTFLTRGAMKVNTTVLGDNEGLVRDWVHHVSLHRLNENNPDQHRKTERGTAPPLLMDREAHHPSDDCVEQER